MTALPKLKPLYKKQLAKLAYHLLNHSDCSNRIRPSKNKTIELRMNCYSTDGYCFLAPHKVEKCGTSCCFLGYSPFVFKNWKWSEIQRWDEVCEKVIGCETTSIMSRFLFSGGWPNDIEQAAKRALFVLNDRAELSHLRDYNHSFYKKLTKEETLDSLRKFI